MTAGLGHHRTGRSLPARDAAADAGTPALPAGKALGAGDFTEPACRRFRPGLVAVLVSLSACATTAHFDQALDGLVGLTEAELIRVRGTPEKILEGDGRRYVSYTTHATAYVAGSASAYQTPAAGANLHSNAIGGTADLPIDLRCTTVFEIVRSRVERWSHQGNYCKSR